MKVPIKLLEEFLASLAGKAEPTQDAYQRELEHFLAWLSQRAGNRGPFHAVQQLTKTALETYLADLQSQGHSISHCARVRLNLVCKVVLDPRCEDHKLRSIIFKRVSRGQLEQASATVDTLTHSDDDNYYEFLLGNYSTIRRFLPLLLRTIAFEAAKAGQSVLDAMRFLCGFRGKVIAIPKLSRSGFRN